MSLNVPTEPTTTSSYNNSQTAISTVSDIQLVQQLYGQARQKSSFLISTRTVEEERQDLTTKMSTTEQRLGDLKLLPELSPTDKKAMAKLTYKLQSYRRSLEYLTFVKGQGTTVWVREPKVYVLIRDQGLFGLGFNKDLLKIALRNGANGETTVGTSFSELGLSYPVMLFYRTYSADNQEVSGFFQMIEQKGSTDTSKLAAPFSGGDAASEFKKQIDSGAVQPPINIITNAWSRWTTLVRDKRRTLDDTAYLNGVQTSFRALLAPFFDVQVETVEGKVPLLPHIQSSYDGYYAQLTSGGEVAEAAMTGIQSMITGANILDANLIALDSDFDRLSEQ